MSIQPGDSSVKCQNAMQINCGLTVKIWATGSFEQQPAMCFQLPPSSVQHICSNVIWQTVMTKSLALPVKWRSQTLLVIHMHRFHLIVQLTSELLYGKQRVFSRNLLSCTHPAPSPLRTASICLTPGLKEEQEACAHSCMKPVCCSPLLWFHARYLTMEPVTLDNKAATWGNNAGFSGFRCPLRRLFSSPRFQTQLLVGKKRGIRWSLIFCRLNQISTRELLREWISGVRGDCSYCDPPLALHCFHLPFASSVAPLHSCWMLKRTLPGTEPHPHPSVMPWRQWWTAGGK